MAARPDGRHPRMTHPILLAARMARANRIATWRSTPMPARLAVPGIAFLALAGTAFALASLGDASATVLARLASQPAPFACAAALLAGVAAMRRHRRLRAAHAVSWLGALPVQAWSHRVALARRGLVPILGIVLATPVLVALPAGGGRPVAALALIIASGCLGAAAGWWQGRHDAPPPRLRDRRLPRHGTTIVPGFEALVRWPLAQAVADGDPGVHARALGALLLLLPMGTTGAQGLGVLAVGASALVVVETSRALLATVPRAAQWLPSAPLALTQWAWPLCRRVVLVQLVAGMLGGLALVALGVAPGSVVVLVAAAWTTVAWLVDTAFAWRDDMRRARVIQCAVLAAVACAAAVSPWALPALFASWAVLRVARRRRS